MAEKDKMKFSNEEINEAAEFVRPFFTMKQSEIFTKFRNLGGDGFFYDKGDRSSLYIRGTREDRVLLIAHVDSVWRDSQSVTPVYDDGLFFSGNKKVGVTKSGQKILCGFGIAADDRAGIALLWRYKELGHSILLLGGEEIGSLGARQIMAMQGGSDEINDHRFMIEFDRHGRNDLVFYDVGTQEFAEYCIENTGYKFAHGSFTDICVLSETCCGLNISVGYSAEHTPNETLNMRWWLKTAKICEKWLSKPELPKFVHA